MEHRYFQWIAGERKGEILIFDGIEYEDENAYITFKDGSRINEEFVAPINTTNLNNKFMAEIDSPNNCWKFEEEETVKKTRFEVDHVTGIKYEIPDIDAMAYADLTGESGVINFDKIKGTKKIKLIPPKPTPKKNSKFETNINEIKPKVVKEETQIQENIISKEIIKENDKNINELDPVYILISKAKKEDVEIKFDMVVSLPPKSLYNIAKTSFENGSENFVKYIIENISEKEIKNSLKDAIKFMYEEDDKIMIDR